VWCKATNPKPSHNQQTVCVACGLDPMPGEDPTKNGKVDPAKAKKSARNRRNAPRRGRINLTPTGHPIIGIDPGARYTGVVVRDGDAVTHSSTLVRPKDMNATDWAIHVVAQVHEILKDFPATIPVAVEGVNDPKGFQHGKRASLNPKDIIRAGIVLGAVVATWPTATVVPPGGNGSQHYTTYPDSLIGRRPANLPGSTNGAGTRDHEQSAYDVAGKAAATAYPKNKRPLRLNPPRKKTTT